MKYFIGLDNGGTTTKAAVFSQTGQEMGTARISTEAILEKPGYVERDMEEMWQANCRVVRQVLWKTGIGAQEIAGVGICGHGKGLYLWGKDNAPVRNGIISTDNRAWMYPEKWRKDGTEEKVFEISCQHIMACQPVALLAWLKEHEPKSYQKIRWVFECKDYVRFRLTGEARGELTDYSGANLLDLHTREYSDRLLELFGIPEIREALPPLCRAAEICGYVTETAARDCGLKAGTPVIGGMFDIDACALAVGVTTPKQICMIAGTWSINEYLRREPVTDGSVLMNSLFAMPEYYLIEESSPTSAGNNEWAVNQLLTELKEDVGPGRIYDTMNDWVASIPPDEFVPIFLPFLMASNVHPNAKGTLIGIGANHTRKHLIRSVYEGIVFCHKYHLDKLLATRTESPQSIRLAGGAARSKVWSQMFADVMQLPVETVEVNETGALGCSIAAAVAVGVYPSLEEATAHMCHIGPSVTPDPSLAEVYAKKYELYLKTIACTDGLWSQMQELAEAHCN